MKYHLLTRNFLAVSLAITPPLQAQALIDRDGDGHSDIWQIAEDIPSGNGADDSDGDGHSDADEETAGTNAWSALSWFRVAEIEIVSVQATRTEGELAWKGVKGKSYQLQHSSDLTAASWLNSAQPLLATSNGPLIQQPDLPSPLNAQFYRVAVSDVDADGDGLTAYEEGIIGTSDQTPNSGGAGSPPDTEVAAQWVAQNDRGITTGTPPPNLREVDVAFIREIEVPSTGAVGADLVTATGTGAWHQLTSWRSGFTPNPSQLATTPPIQGHHPQVHLLDPPAVAGAPKFLTGRIASDGNLWLSSRSLTVLGTFVHHKTLGFGENANLDVLAFDLAHRTFSTREAGVIRYQVVSAVHVEPSGGGSRHLRAVTWNVNPTTGAISGLQFSDPLSAPGLSGQPKLRIAAIAGNQFEIIYTDIFENQCHLPLWTDDNGFISSLPGTSTPLNIRGSGEVSHERLDSVITGLTGSGYATALLYPDNEGVLQRTLQIWDRRPDFYTADTYESHLLTDDSLDLIPNTPGIGLTAPTLTDSFIDNPETGEALAQALATGDFNGDGFDDAAIAAPQRDVNGLSNAGGIFILHGSVTGMENREYVAFWTQNSDDVLGDAAEEDRYGSALASGDFNGDGNDDLAIGIPDKDIGAKNGAGSVQILYGTPFGLSATDNQLITRDSLGQLSAAGDDFGRALCTGDFNGDGRTDLAIGAPGQTVSSQTAAGAVHVLWGAAAGLSTAGSEMFHQDSPGLADTAEASDRFGSALVSGQFNGGIFADLAIGVPLEDVGSATDAGAVQVVYGNAGGFSGSNFITRDGFDGGLDIQGSPADGDNFGWSLAAGDFDGDTAQDLAIGAPGDAVAGPFTGAVHVVYGSFFGLTWAENQFIRQIGSLDPASSLPNTAAEDEDLGWSLTAGDTNGDGFSELIASAPGEDINNKADAGIVFVIPGSAGGLLPVDAVRLHQDTIREENEVQRDADSDSTADDKFGITLASADFNSDGEADFISGIPRKDNADDQLGTGGAHFFHGTASIDEDGPNYFTLSNDFMWTPKTRESVRAMVTDLIRENSGGVGAGKLYSFNESLDIVHMASSTKTMTLLLAAEAIEDGFATLDDPVLFTKLAGETGGSLLDARNADSSSKTDENGARYGFFDEGDTMPLRFLLAAMMGESCNRASVAIGQHIAFKVTGSQHEFVNMMQARADELEMDTSIFGHPAGGWACKVQDAITLQREGVKHPIFVEYSSFENWGDDQPEEVLCGTDFEGVEKCNGPHAQFMSMGTYPGRYTWKGGNGLVWFEEGQINNWPPRPDANRCTTSRVTTALRMNRTLSACLQQTGNGDAQSQNLMDYGFRELFTPDHRDLVTFPESGGLVGPEGPVRSKNFATTSWTGHGCAVLIDDYEEIRLNIWALNYTTNQISPAGFAQKSYTLQSGTSYEEPALIDLVKVPTTDSIADFFTVTQVGDALELEIWRSGQE